MDEELKARLLKPRLPEADVDVPGVGLVRVRGLNRAEAMIVQGANGPEATERRIVAFGMVDPTMTEAEVGQWQRNGPAGELEPVSIKIAELSGMLEGAGKSGVPSDGGLAGPGVPVLPGARAGDAGLDAAPGDE